MMTNPMWPDVIAVEPEEVGLLISLMEMAHVTVWHEKLPSKIRAKYARMYSQLLTHSESIEEMTK